MLIDLHGHQPLFGMLEQHPTWGPFWEFDDTGHFHLRVGKWVLNLSTKEQKAAVEAGMVNPRKQNAKDFFAEHFTPEAKIAAMDAREVDKLVISHSSHWYMYWTEKEFGTRFASLVNDEFASFCSGHPDRLYWWGHVPMQDTAAAVAEAERAIKMGARGIGMGGANFGGRDAYDKDLYPLWKKLCDLDVPVFVHGYNQSCAWGDKADTDEFDTTAIVGMCYDETRLFWHMINGGVLDEFPDLKIYITHGGGMVPYQLGRFEGTNEVLGDARNKKPFRSYMKNFWFDPLIHELPMRKAMVEVIGVDRLLYGDNFGGSDGIREDLTANMGLSPEDRDKIRWKNAAELLRIDVNPTRANAGPQRAMAGG